MRCLLLLLYCSIYFQISCVTAEYENNKGEGSTMSEASSTAYLTNINVNFAENMGEKLQESNFNNYVIRSLVGIANIYIANIYDINKAV